MIFRLSGGQGLWITVSLGLPADSPIAADIVFRYLQRLCQALAERMARFQSAASIDETESRRPTRMRRPRRDPGRAEPGLLTALFARAAAASIPGRAADVKPVAPGPGRRQGDASPTAGTRG